MAVRCFLTIAVPVLKAQTGQSQHDPESQRDKSDSTRRSGLETIERLRGTGSFSSEATTGIQINVPLPWILISGALDEATITRARAASVFSVLPKPLRLAELTGAVTGALRQAYDWRAA